jgi:hypothetical protein
VIDAAMATVAGELAGGGTPIRRPMLEVTEKIRKHNLLGGCLVEVLGKSATSG